MLSGAVTDPTGAVLRGAVVSLELADHSGTPSRQEETSDQAGKFHFKASPGTYALTVNVPGFAPYRSRLLKLEAKSDLRISVRLTVASLHQEIDVLQDEGSAASDPDSSMGAMVFQGEQLGLLSNDPQTLRQQLTALAGGGTPSFLINGFSGARLPPKSSIRSIRINQNPFSAYFSDFGLSRIEVDTKPGTDKLHGSVTLSGTDRPLDAPNPYTPVQPPFYDFQEDGQVNGPLGSKTSFFLGAAVERLANNAVVNAANPANPALGISTSVAAPQNTQTYSVRVDRQFAERNYGYVRDEWSETRIANCGIVPLVLPNAAYTSNTLTNALQASDTQVIGSHAVNEGRFQYLRTRVQQQPNSSLPSVVVQGAFQSGGSPSQSLQDNQDAYEIQDRFELDHGRHSIRAGFRFRALRDANRSSAGFNGQYIFPDAASYLAGQATQYSQTVGQQSAVLLTNDLGVFAEDDWKLSPYLTLSYGLRFENQTAVPDHNNPAPRVALAWSVVRKGSKSPILTLRAGYGLFYTRFPAAQLLQAVRQNGLRQVAYLAQNTAFNPNGPPPDLVLNASAPTIYRVNPQLRTPYTQIARVLASHSFGRFGTVSGTYVYARHTHDYLTRNLNAPLPGTVDPTNPGTGVRPYGDENLYQFSSDANGDEQDGVLDYRFQATSHVFAFGSLIASRSKSETDGVTHFPSNEYNLRQDYARTADDRTLQYTGGFQVVLPHGFQVTPFLAAHTGAPFDITTGTDLNGDTIYNDRPAIATDLTRSSVVRTAYGNFDVLPAAGQAVLPRNYGTSPGLVWVQLQASKDFHLGPRPKAAASTDGKPGPAPDRPWDLNFAVEVHNLMNHNNPGLPVGVLSAQPCGTANSAACGCLTSNQASCSLVPSQYFGHSLSLANDFSPVTASNRTILLQTSFTW